MKYNFDEYRERRNSDAVKMDFVEVMFGSKDVLPMWVADMDFRTAQPIIDALSERVNHGIYGYTSLSDGYYQSFIDWVKRRHDWTVEKDWLIYSPGVVPTLIYAVQTLTEVGDKIVIQSPVYGPFKGAIENHGRVLVDNPLKCDNGQYQMDFDDLEETFKSGVKAMIFCNPHNPVGRVWTKEELSQLKDLIVKYNVYLISDEIHSDLTLKGHKHIAIASLDEELAKRTITCMAPSKTFNLAGLQSSIVVVSNPELKARLRESYEKMDMNLNNCFGQVAFEAAYNHGEEWLEQLLDYIENNMDFVVDYIETNIPEIKVYKPEGTYLMWFDFRALGMTHEALKAFLNEKAKVGMTGGDFFGKTGEGFMRYNVATTRERVKQGLKQIEAAIKELR